MPGHPESEDQPQGDPRETDESADGDEGVADLGNPTDPEHPTG